MIEKVKNGITELVFILDRSGSMSGLEKDTIGGFNAMIEKQKKLEGKAYISTVLFDSAYEMLHDRVDIEKIEPMDEKQYYVRGTTALLDAVGRTIRHITKIHRYIRPEDVPEHTIFVITTDGMENASVRYTAEEVKKMIRHEEEKYGWEFMFLGANIDAVATAASIGIRKERASNYEYTREGTGRLYDAVEKCMRSIRTDKPMAEEWKSELFKE